MRAQVTIDECGTSENMGSPCFEPQRQVRDTRFERKWLKLQARIKKHHWSNDQCGEQRGPDLKHSTTTTYSKKMKDMEVDHVLATNCVLAWNKNM